jgi:hypothetical protein
MLSVCDGATMALDDHEKPVIPINRVIVSLIEKTRVRIYWYRDVTSCSRVDYTIAFAIWSTMLSKRRAWRNNNRI